MSRLVCDRSDDVARFVADRIGIASIGSFGDFQAIGVEQDGRIVSGVLYHDFNGTNVWMHFATDVPITRYLLAVAFDYPFNQMGCSRLTGWVEASNTKARDLDLNLGFSQEAVLEGAARDGGDVLIMRMFKKECRFLKLGGRYAL